MIVSIIACGDSAKEWYKTPCDLSVGCNDSAKWGHKLNHLLVVNHPSKFSNEPGRFKHIIESKPDKFFAHSRAWSQWFPNMEFIRPIRLVGRLRKGVYYHSQTSPFVAMSHAFNIGATEIVLWGVDMRTHKVYHDRSKAQTIEVDRYKRFIAALEKHGVKVYLGAEGSVLNLPIWEKK